MNSVGIIAEYNPFHNGHLYHLNKVKKLYPNKTIILVMGSSFMERGEASIINKWDKTKIALEMGIDLVVELPFPFASQAADIFAQGNIEILKALKVDTLVFGSESNDLTKLTKIANIQLDHPDYDDEIKKAIAEGISYPKAISQVLTKLGNEEISTPNDLLGVAYIKEIIKQKAKIEPITIKRTNDYHDLSLDNEITSASSIRKALAEKKDVSAYVPTITNNYLSNNLHFTNDYFSYLKYQIICNIDHLDKYHGVEEGIENRIKKYILESNSLEELISKVKTKRYTYNKLRRMFTHILTNFTKEEAKKFEHIEYLRILGFSNKGRNYLNKIKKDIELPIVTNFKKLDNEMLELEYRVTMIYAAVLDKLDSITLIGDEYKNKPIMKC